MQDDFGDTALIEACDGGYVATAALLIDKGARVNYKNKVDPFCLFVYSHGYQASLLDLKFGRGESGDRWGKP